MFGYLTTNYTELSKEDNRRYRSWYCGLCNRLNESYGNTGRKTLTYDFTFITILLSSVYPDGNTVILERCPLHPLKKHEATYNGFSTYCADMNIYLSYYKHLDDVADDNSASARKMADTLLPFISRIEEKYPDKCKTVKEELRQISMIEKDNILNPDLGANHFGQLLGELLYVNENEDLKRLGFHLGRFIYLLDAVIDLKDDLKKGHYNPLTGFERSNHEEMLLMVMEDVDSAYRQLGISEPILENIIYSGIWSKYDLNKRKEKRHERSL
ncbi:MAG: hypothetical protein J5887_05570 [Erysipelotrichaceae bacterium]|nr:hypothetical protein [Erysipelotrichaceae bacterium]